MTSREYAGRFRKDRTQHTMSNLDMENLESLIKDAMLDTRKRCADAVFALGLSEIAKRLDELEIE